MKKGFTMVELLAVFTLMGAILIISMPKITSLLKKNEESSYTSFKNTICIAAEAYVVNNKVSIANGSSKNIEISTLISSGYLKSDLKYPLKSPINGKKNEKVSTMSNKTVAMIKDGEGILSCDLNGL